jgi:hypothetical protein
MSAAREPDQSDFDLDRFVDLFDEAMTSTDPRVVETLRRLMMIVTLTRPESSQSWNDHRGPLRRMMSDINHLHRRIETLEGHVMSDRGSTDEYYKHMAMTGAKNLASQIDADVLKQLAQRDYGYNGSPKGLLEK